MSNNSPLPIIAVGALGLSSISCVISSLTGFLVLDDSNVESNTSTSNTSTDTSNTSTSNTSTSNTSTSNTSTSNTYTIPHQIELGTDGWCIGTDSVHQDVPGCGRICSSATNAGSKTDGTWGPWEDTNIPCTGAKLDEIWEKQDDGTRKLADGYMLSTFGKPSYFEEGGEDANVCDEAAAKNCAEFKNSEAGNSWGDDEEWDIIGDQCCLDYGCDADCQY